MKKKQAMSAVEAERMGNYAIRTIVEILAAAPTFEEAKAGLDGTFAEVELHLRKHYGANVQ